MKFSRGSLTRVTVSIEEEPPAQLSLPPPSRPRRPVLRVDVADRGVGLSPEECQRMFLPFEHAAPEQARVGCCCWWRGCACDTTHALTHETRVRAGWRNRTRAAR
jgi:hypothetical protein